jgi:hypothetical protein
VARPGGAGDPRRPGDRVQAALTPWSYADLDLARIFRREQRGPADAQQWGNSYHGLAQQDPKLALWCPDPLVTTGVMASLQEFHPGQDTDEMDSLDLEATACHGNLRGAVWRKASDSGSLLPAFGQIVLPHPLDLGTEQQGNRLVLLGPTGARRQARLHVGRRSRGQGRPQAPGGRARDARAGEPPQVQPKAPRPPLPPKPGFSKAAQIKEAMASPILGIGTAPAGRNIFAKATEVPGPGPAWWQERERRQKLAEAAADKRIAEREQKEALKRAKEAPGSPRCLQRATTVPMWGAGLQASSATSHDNRAQNYPFEMNLLW